MLLVLLYSCRAKSRNAPEQHPTRDSLLQGNETGRVRSTDTRATVTDGVVRDRELSQVVADHLRLDLDGVELLARVDTNDGADHLRNDDHVTEVSLDDSGLLIRRGLLLRLAELLDQAHRLALEAAVEPSAGTGVDDIAELLAGEVEELIQVDAAVGELAERSLSLQLSCLLWVVFLVGHDCGVSRRRCWRCGDVGRCRDPPC